MERRFNVQQPTVIATELRPLDESFYLDGDGSYEQWYYDNTQQYAPNRFIIPLVLTPHIHVVDGDTNLAYDPAISSARWFVNEYDTTAGDYVEREITASLTYNNTTQQYEETSTTINQPYAKKGNQLRVNKNVSYSHGVNIRCVLTYVDPRDSGVTHTVQDSLQLTTNRDAEVVFPEVEIVSPSGRSFNPLTDYQKDENGNLVIGSNGKYIQESEFEFVGKVTNNPVTKNAATGDVATYKADGWGTEQMIPTNENGAESVAPVMDIVYADGVDDGDQADGQYVEGLDTVFRATGNGGVLGVHQGNAYVKAIRGNTVVWNQQCNAETSTFSECTITKNADGTFTVSGTGTSARYKTITKQFGASGHKVFYRYKIISGSGLSIYDVGNVNPAGGYVSTDKELIFTQENLSSFTLIRAANSTENCTFSFVCFDLTLIYGEGNEPTTVEQFEADYQKWFGHPLAYEPYNAGSLIPVKTTAVKTNGFNQWDEEWETGVYNNTTGEKANINTCIRCKNYIRCLPNTTYATTTNWLRWLFYTEDKTFISWHAGVNTIVSPSNAAYMTFYCGSEYGTTYNHDICINLAHDNSRNGEYEAHLDKTTKLPLTEVTGIADGSTTSVPVFPDGMKRVGNVYDEIKYEGGELVAYKRVGSVDLGTLYWARDNTYSSGIYRFRTYDISTLIRLNTTSQIVPTWLVCAKYNNLSPDKTFGFPSFIGNGITVETAGAITIYDATYDTSAAATFKTAMSGVMLYYELAEPIRYVLDRVQPITDFIWYGVDATGEHLVETMPYYKEGQGTDTIKVDAMYGENINIMLRCTKTTGSDVLSPSRAYASLAWRIPNVDIHTMSRNGSAVRSNTKNMVFEPIVNVKGDVIDELIKSEHMRFNWKHRRDQETTENDDGWGQDKTLAKEQLINVRGSSNALANTLVYPVAYVMGAYEQVATSSSDNTPITDNGEVVYDRPVE